MPRKAFRADRNHDEPSSQAPCKGALNHIVQLAARLFDVPLAVTVIDDGAAGLDIAAVGMTTDEAAHLLQQLELPADQHRVTVADDGSLARDEKPLTLGDEPLRFAAVAPIIPGTDPGLDGVWLFDLQHRVDFDDQQRRDLQSLAALLEDEVILRRTNDQLRRAHRNQELILEVMPAALLFADPQRQITGANQTFTDMYGYSAEEVRGRTTEFLYANPEDFARTARHYNPDATEQTDPYRVEYRRKDGSTFLGETIGVPIRDDQGETLGYLGTIRDVTDKVRVEQERLHALQQLRESEKLLRETSRMARIGGGKYDIRTGEVTWSEQLYRLHELPVGEPLSREQTLEFFQPSDRQRLQAAIDETIDTGQPHQLELPMTTATGRRQWVRIKSSPLIEDGEVVGVTGYHQDITEEKQAAEAKREFISVVSHELRTPLTSIQGSISLVANEVFGALPEEAEQVMGIALRNTRRLAALIDDILDIEKIESGKLQLHLVSADAAEIVDEVAATNRQFATDAGVRLITDVPDEPAPIRVDPDKLHQVLTNLVSNAIKVSDQNDCVELVVQHDSPDMVRLSVRDRGPGIPRQFRDRLFEKFTRAAPSSDKPGTGLGLSIAKSLTEQMHGQIGFDTSVDEGTTMWVAFPVADGGSDQ